MATGMSPLPNLAGLAPAQPLGGDGLIDLIATVPFQHADPRGGGLRTASSSSPTRAVRSGKIADSLEDPLAEFRAVKEVLAITGD